MRFLEYFSPQLASSTAELHRYYPKLQTQLSVNTVLRSVFMVYWHLGRLSSQQGRAFTSRWACKSTQQCAHGTICRDSRPGRWEMQKQRSSLRGRRAAPCWPLCTGRRTSACPTGPRTPLEQSSGCSRARPELQRKQQHQHLSNLNLRVQRVNGVIPSQPSIKLTLQEWWAHVQVAYLRLDASRSAPPKALKAPFTWCICAK